MRFRLTFLSRSSRAPAGCLGRVGMALFFSVFLLMGLGFAVFLGTELVRGAMVRTWTPTPCTILASEVTDKGGEDPYLLRIHYRYTVDGRSYDGDRVHRRETDSGDYASIQRLADRYPADSRATCLVNPADPAEAVLEAESLWFGLFIFLPLIFIVIGGGGVYYSLRPPAPASQPLSSTSTGPRELSARGQVVLFGIFLIVGLVMAAFMGQWLWNYFDARTWPAVPAKIISSRVQHHRGDDGSTYSIDILYAYEFDQRTYRSNRYSFFSGSSSGREGKQAVVRQYPPGAQAVCYVNPDDPGYAVLHRGWSWELMLSLLPLAFLGLGVYGLHHSLTRSHRSRSSTATVTASRGQQRTLIRRHLIDPSTPANAGTAGEVVLKPAGSPAIMAAALGAFGLLWNGIVGAMTASVLDEGSFFAICFLVPFIAVGLGIIGAAIYYALKIRNPRPTVILADGRLPLGSITRLRWSFSGNTQPITRLRITLEGRESATYRRGTDTTTDHHTFARHTLIDTAKPVEIRGGEVRLAIPADTMHSLTASSNRIEWRIIVHGEIANWPDVDEPFEVWIEPLPAPASETAHALAS